ncbi:1,2-dihydroxy-3-keto-5-methylthiopentene dioxygenase, partial [Coemansia sp. RSA 1933]
QWQRETGHGSADSVSGPASIFRGHLAGITSVVALPTQPLAYSGSLDSRIGVWRVGGGGGGGGGSGADSFASSELVGHTDAVWDLSLSTRASLLASVSADATCRLWSTTAGKDSSGSSVLTHMRDKRTVPTSVAFTAMNGSRLAIGYADGRIETLDTQRGGGGAAMAAHQQHQQLNGRITKVVSRPDESENVVGAACADGS